MYAKDKLGIRGFIQEGVQEDRSYYYSLPGVEIVDRITYTGKGGVRREIDVTGQGWVDRQWGDFLTKSWEWSSVRFAHGARVNLYNFANGYQVATYQKADGSTQWLDSFLVRQNGYLRTPKRGVWLSWGWSYEFPVEVEGSRHYTLEPFSKLDVFENPNNIFFAGPSRLINYETGATVGRAVMSRWTFVSCRMRRMLPTNIDGFKKHTTSEVRLGTIERGDQQRRSWSVYLRNARDFKVWRLGESPG
jgi:hypothetical protein